MEHADRIESIAKLNGEAAGRKAIEQSHPELEEALSLVAQQATLNTIEVLIEAGELSRSFDAQAVETLLAKRISTVEELTQNRGPHAA